VEKEMLLKREEAKKTGECRVKHEHGDNKLNRPCGGDGSKKCRTARQLLMRWGVYGIGEHSAEFWASPGQRGSADYGLGRKPEYSATPQRTNNTKENKHTFRQLSSNFLR